jgi:signal transduction histidine kinase
VGASRSGRNRRIAVLLVSVSLSLAITAAMSLLFHRGVRADFMATGLVCAIMVGAIIDRIVRQYRDALRRANSQLEQRVVERTAELERLQRELMIRDRMATAGMLAAGVGHEIRSPLAAISAGAEYLAGVVEAKQNVRETVTDILDASAQIEVILKDLATLATPVDEAPTSVELAPVVATAARLAAYHVKRGTRLTVAPFEVPPVVGVPSRLIQVVLNLIVNAARAARPDAPNQVQVTAVRNGDGVELDVIDTGIGMDAATVARAFEPFFTTRRDRGGTGLGLAVCRTIVESSGGRIELASTPGEGTRARVVLRVAAA